MKNINNKRDGHIHSPYCPHGTDDGFELYIKEAIKLGLEEISFTEHMPLSGEFMDPEFLKTCAPSLNEIEGYFKELEKIKLKYINDIKINIGVEVDYIEGYEEETKEVLNKYGDKIEDSILSVHFIKIEDKYHCMDYSAEEFGELVEKAGGVEKIYDIYYETLLKAIKADFGDFKPKRIGHPTLVRIFNKKFPLDYKNTKLLEDIVKEIKERSYQIDLNTAGLRKKYCREIYPSGKFAELIESYEIETVYGSDAHNALDVGKGIVAK
ncbi:MAG: histidinol-phosphatase HisJ [Clostridiaceae bacterium]